MEAVDSRRLSAGAETDWGAGLPGARGGGTGVAGGAAGAGYFGNAACVEAKVPKALAARALGIPGLEPRAAHALRMALEVGGGDVHGGVDGRGVRGAADVRADADAGAFGAAGADAGGGDGGAGPEGGAGGHRAGAGFVQREVPRGVRAAAAADGERETDRCCRIFERVVHKHYVGTLSCDVGSGAYCDPCVSLCESRCVVDPVSHESDFSVFLHQNYCLGFFFRQDSRDDFINSRFSADCACRSFVVACEHEDLEPHFVKLTYRFGGITFYRICDRDDPQKRVVFGKIERGFAFLGQFLIIIFNGIRSFYKF